MKREYEVDISRYPAVMSQHASPKASGKYGFIPTTRVVDLLRQEGFVPVRVNVTRTPWPDRRAYAKHTIRFRHRDHLNAQAVVGEVVPEIVVGNSHDTGSCFLFNGGLYRFVCSNGAIVADGLIASVKIVHIHYEDDRVLEAVAQITGQVPMLLDRVDRYRALILDQSQQFAVAEAALAVRYSPEKLARYDVPMEQLLAPKRKDDAKPSLWNTYNILQEKLVMGGDRLIVDTHSSAPTTARRVKPIEGVEEDIRVNQGLWHVMDRAADIIEGNELLTVEDLVAA
jgi:hypothetical protein